METIVQHDRFFARLIGLIPAELYLHSETLTGYNAKVNNTSASNKKVKIVAPTKEGKSDDESEEEEDSLSGEEEDDGDDDDQDEEGDDDDDESGVEVDEDDDEEEEEGDDAGTDGAGYGKFYKHRKLPLTADERKARSQENKKRKYGVDEDDNQPTTSSSANATTDASEGSEVKQNSMEDLRKKLQERILLLKSQRQSKKQRVNDNIAIHKDKTAASSSSNKNKNKQLKEVIAADLDQESVDSLKNDLASYGINYGDDEDNMSALTNDSAGRQKAANDSNFEFSTILKYDKEQFLKPKESASKKDGGKVKRLQRLLQEAEKKRDRLKALTTSGDDILVKKARGEQWNDALESAAGGKPLVVSTTGAVSQTEIKLKKALKRREKKKAKSAEEWANRLQKVEDDKQLKLQKREDNLAKKKNRADENVKQTIVRDTEAAAANAANGHRKPVSIKRPGDNDNKGGRGNNNNHQQGQKKNNRAGFEGKKSAGSFLNHKN